MQLVVDASAFLAVALNEDERAWIVSTTQGAKLAAPTVLPYEIGNALVAIVKRGRLAEDEALAALRVAQSIPVQLGPVDVEAAIGIAFQVKSYAYDAFYLHFALSRKLPLLTLDSSMRKAAKALGISVVEEP